jgi:hypothetical protein
MDAGLLGIDPSVNSIEARDGRRSAAESGNFTMTTESLPMGQLSSVAALGAVA